MSVMFSLRESFKCQGYTKARRAPGVKCLSDFFFSYGVRLHFFMPQPHWVISTYYIMVCGINGH